MFKPFALFFFVINLVWAGAILITTDPHARLHRAALPIALVGKATVAVVVQFEPDWAAPVYNFFLKTEHGFKYMLWSVFYEEEWRAASAETALKAPKASDSSGTTAPASSGSRAAPSKP
jgi:hypothetical protein